MALPVFSPVVMAKASRFPRCFQSCHANSDTLPNAVSRPVASWRRTSVAPGVLSSAPSPPPRPPRPPRPPPPPPRPRCAARGRRSLRRILPHCQPRARRAEGERFDSVHRCLIAGSQIDQPEFVLRRRLRRRSVSARPMLKASHFESAENVACVPNGVTLASPPRQGPRAIRSCRSCD